GGKYRQIMVDIDPTRLAANGLTPLDVVNVVNAQSLTLPSGTAKMGDKQYTVRTNAMPPTIDDLNNIPVKVVNGATVFVKDVGQVHDGWLVQQNVVREDGRRSVLLSIIKNGNASSSEAVTQNFWTDPKSGISYYLAVQTPEHSVSSLNDLGNTPVSSALSSGKVPVPGLLSNVATFKRDTVPTNANQTNIQPVYEVYASVQGRDLGSISDQISKVVADLQKQLSPGNSIHVVGQIQSMNNAFWDLGVGLLFAAVFVYLLMVVNYQNFGDPFVVILALPATLCGILTMLFITGTTLNVPS